MSISSNTNPIKYGQIADELSKYNESRDPKTSKGRKYLVINKENMTLRVTTDKRDIGKNEKLAKTRDIAMFMNQIAGDALKHSDLHTISNLQTILARTFAIYHGKEKGILGKLFGKNRFKETTVICQRSLNNLSSTVTAMKKELDAQSPQLLYSTFDLLVSAEPIVIDPDKSTPEQQNALQEAFKNKRYFKPIKNPNAPGIDETERAEREKNIQNYNSKKQQLQRHLNTKRAFMTSHCSDPELARQISSQNSQYSIMQAAVNALKESYASWNPDTHGDKLQKLKDKIITQHANIAALSKVLSGIKNQKGIRELVFIDNTAEQLNTEKRPAKKQIESEDIRDLKEKLKPFIRGDQALSKSDIDSLKAEIRGLAGTRQAEIEKLEGQKEKSPISSTLIQKEASVFQASREAQQWAEKQESLTKYGDSVNAVSQVKHTLDFQPDLSVNIQNPQKDKSDKDEIEKAFGDDKILSNYDVSVTVVNGAVYLSGELESDELIKAFASKADQIMKNRYGEKIKVKVVNYIKNTYVQKQISNAFAADKNLAKYLIADAEKLAKYKRVKVDVVDGVAYLSGELRSQGLIDAFASEAAKIVGEGNVVNNIRNTYRDDKLDAFVKVGNDKAAALMEKLMWKAAGLLGMEEYFTPTKDILVTTKKGQIIKGSIQPSQGKVIANATKAQRTKITQGELAGATLASLVFGMFDAHDNNIILTDNGELRFFDNTRSMPNSNGAIRHGGYLLSSYRFGLTKLDGCHQSLTPEDIGILQSKISEYRSKLDSFKKLMNSAAATLGPVLLPNGKPMLKNGQPVMRTVIPEGWITPGAMKAMSERIDNMEKAVKNAMNKDPPTITLNELIFEALPEYKFFAALTVAYQAAIKAQETNAPIGEFLKNTQFQREYSSYTGAFSIDELLNNVAEMGIDPRKIQELCNKSSKFEDIMKGVAELYENRDGATSKNAAKESSQKLIAEYQAKSALDNKDIFINQFPKEVTKEAKAAFDRLVNIGIPNGAELPEPFEAGKPFLLLDPPRLIFCFKRNAGDSVIEAEIDYYSSPGKIFIHGKEMDSVQSLEALARGQIPPPPLPQRKK